MQSYVDQAPIANLPTGQMIRSPQIRDRSNLLNQKIAKMKSDIQSQDGVDLSVLDVSVRMLFG
jgi:hypothetical protein